MGIFDDAHVTVLLADYIGVDAAGKINALGAGFALTGLQPTGMTAPQHVAAIVDLPAKYAGHEFPMSIELRDEQTDTLVQLPGPAGQLDAMRIQQLVKGDRASFPGLYLPDNLPVRIQLTLGFVNGLPLTPGRSYAWRVEIDGHHRKGWYARFYVPGPPPGPVFGGPAGPADIPNVQPPSGGNV